MPQENVEVARRAFDAYRRRDIDGFISHLDEQFELRSAIVGGAEGKVYSGHRGVRTWLATLEESFADLTIEPTEYRDVGGETVLVFGRIQARGRESGIEVDSPTGWALTVRAGKVVKALGFLSRAEALEAAGVTG